jgi:hypothetical protein
MPGLCTVHDTWIQLFILMYMYNGQVCQMHHSESFPGAWKTHGQMTRVAWDFWFVFKNGLAFTIIEAHATGYISSRQRKGVVEWTTTKSFKMLVDLNIPWSTRDARKRRCNFLLSNASTSRKSRRSCAKSSSYVSQPFHRHLLIFMCVKHSKRNISISSELVFSVTLRFLWPSEHCMSTYIHTHNSARTNIQHTQAKKRRSVGAIQEMHVPEY